MKSIKLAFLLLASAFFMSCSENDIFSQEHIDKGSIVSSDYITFIPTSDSVQGNLYGNEKATRGITVNAGSLNNFLVWSFFPSNGSFYIGNSTEGGLVEKDSEGNWTNTFGNVTWPNSSLSFTAVAPNCSYYTLKDDSLLYKVPTNAVNDIDFLTASVSNLKQTDNGSVPLSFKHQLAGINFSAKVIGADQYVEIKSITICNVDKNSIKLDLKTGRITTYNSNSFLNEFKLDLDNAIPLTSSNGNVNLSNNDQIIFLPPQTLDGWDEESYHYSTQDCYLDIECKERYKDYYIVGSESEYGHLYKGFKASLKAGENINYCLIFNDGPYVDPGKGWNIKWSLYNLGATKVTENGDFFAWAEKTGRSKNNYNFIGKNTPYFSSYNGHENDQSNLSSRYFTYSKYNSKDNKKVLESTDDAVTTLYGKGYRLPTISELQKLYKYKYSDGKVVFLTGKTIYIPNNGRYDKTQHVNNGSYAYLWSSTRHPSTEGVAYYNSGNSGGRETGMGIRPVMEK